MLLEVLLSVVGYFQGGVLFEGKPSVGMAIVALDAGVLECLLDCFAWDVLQVVREMVEEAEWLLFVIVGVAPAMARFIV